MCTLREEEEEKEEEEEEKEEEDTRRKRTNKFDFEFIGVQRIDTEEGPRAPAHRAVMW
jgi:hypothetical protein